MEWGRGRGRELYRGAVVMILSNSHSSGENYEYRRKNEDAAKFDE